jgi:hypothetical protein
MGPVKPANLRYRALYGPGPARDSAGQAQPQPSRETVANRSQGVESATIRELVTYWGPGYDWRRCEANLNALPRRQDLGKPGT